MLTTGAVPEAVRVQMLGEFSVACGNVTIHSKDKRSLKGKSLLAYLIYNRDRVVPNEELIRILGKDKDTAPVAAMRTTVYRMRCFIKPVEEQIGMPLILTLNGSYRWNPDIPLQLDAARFEELCTGEPGEGEDAPAYWRTAMDLYRGDFLQGLASERWVEPVAEHYRRLCLAAVDALLTAMDSTGGGQEAERYCRDAITRFPYEESLYRWLIRILADRGDPEGASAAYESLRRTLYKDLGVKPEEETRRLIQEVLLAGGRGALTVDDIWGMMKDEERRAGPMVCEMDEFKLFCRSETRSAARRGDAIHMVILTLESKEGPALSNRSLKHAMGQLLEQLCRCLRNGDIVSACSPSQYIIMLLQANYENSCRVAARVEQAFNRANNRSPACIRTDILPLIPEDGAEGSLARAIWH